jgi:hypothetical protein
MEAGEIMDRDFKGIWIPKEILNRYGANTAAMISSFYFKAPGYESNLRYLRKHKLIYHINYDKTQIVKMLVNKCMDGYGIGNKICMWCGIRTITLHEHHYPISKADGGTKTVMICPNCHQEYHSLLNKNSWDLVEEVKQYYAKCG